MNDNSISIQRGTGRKYRMIVATLIVTIIGGIPSWIAVQEIRSGAILKARIADIKSEGLPTDSASLADWFKCTSYPEGTAAWEEVILASKEATEFPPTDLPILGDGRLPTSFHPDIPWPEADSVNQYLNELAPVLQKVDQASSFPRPVWLPIEFNGIETELDPPKEMVAVVHMVQLDGLWALYQRNTERALKDIQRIDAIAESFDWSFCMLTQMISNSIRSSESSLIQHSLNMDLWNEDELARLRMILSHPRNFDTCWNKVAIGERAGTLAAVNNFTLEGDIAKYWNPIWSSDKLALLHVYDDWLSMGKGGIDGLVDRAQKWRLGQSPAPKTTELDRARSLRDILLPSLDQYAIVLEREEECRRLLLVAIGIKQFQRKHHRWPGSLSELSDIGLDAKGCRSVGDQAIGFQVAEGVAYAWTADRMTSPTITSSLPPFADPTLEDPWYFVTIR